MIKKLSVVTAAVFICVAFVGQQAAMATSGINSNFNRQVTVSLSGLATGCDNSSSTIEISGALTLGSVGVKMTLKNNVIGTHTYVTTGEGDLVIDPLGTISIPKQPVLGGVGGNPKIWVRFTDSNGHALTDYLFAGRCVQGANLNTLSALLSVPAAARAFFSSLDCSNKGSQIHIDSESDTAGVNAEVVFTNNDKWTHKTGPHDAVASLQLTSPITAPKAGNLGGAGGNPRVYGNFLLQGANLTDPIYLGRCNKL